jgi:tetratricopeptide (TPR) repeat protein
MKILRLLLVITVFLITGYRSEGQTPSVNEEIARARELAVQGKTTEASEILTGLMGKYPASRDVVQNWLMLNMKRSPTGEEEALVQLDELQKTYPENLGIIFFKTFIQTEYKHFDAALENAEKLIAAQPDTSLNWLMKGQILEFLNRNDEALTSYIRSTSLDPHNADTWQNLAGLYAKTGKLDEAVAAYTKAITLAPGIAVFIYNRGCAYCRKGDNGNALADLGKAVSIEPALKEYARKDEDYKTLWENEDFIKLTGM